MLVVLDALTFRRTDFRAFRNIISSWPWGTIIGNTRKRWRAFCANWAEKDMGLARCAMRKQSWAEKKKNLADDAPDNAGRLVQDPNEAGQQVYRNWRAISQAHRSVIPEDHCESMLRHVQPAVDDIAWEVQREEFEVLLVTKRESAADLDGLPYSAFRCVGGIGTRFLCEAYQHLYAHGEPFGGVCSQQRRVRPKGERRRRQWTPGPSSRCPAASHAAHLSLQNLHHGYVLWIEEVFARVRSSVTKVCKRGSWQTTFLKSRRQRVPTELAPMIAAFFSPVSVVPVPVSTVGGSVFAMAFGRYERGW